MKKLFGLFLLLLAIGVMTSFIGSLPKADAVATQYCHPEHGGKYPYTLSDDNSSGSFVYSGNCVKGTGPGAEDDFKQCISDWCVSHVPQVTPTPTHGVTPTPTHGVTPTPTQGVTPTPTVICNADHDCTPTATPTVVPTSEATPTTPPSPHGDGLSDGRSSCPECTQAPHNTQAVLGAETMAATGAFDTQVMNFVLLGGMLSMGAAAYAKAKKA